MREWTVPGYTELRELGHGMPGKLVEAVHDSTGDRVAIKYLSPALVRDSAFMWEFRTDAQMFRQLRVPQVVRVYDYVEQAGQGAAIVMELVNGVSLREMIERRGPIGPEAALVVLKDSLHGLAAVHQLGLVHRDYKPENVLVDTAGRSKLTDFGLPVWADEHVPAAGPPLYMAPELWSGAPSSPATDIYAATAIFFECLTGKPPFSGHTEDLSRQHRTAAVPLDRVDPPLRPLIGHGMAKDPAGRPQSAIAFVAELDAAAAAAYGPGWEQRGRGQLAKSSRRNRRILAIAAIGTVLVVAGGALAAGATLTAENHQASLSGVTTAAPSFNAVANVTPPVAASKCTTATAFTYSGELTGAVAGKVSYRWVYSTGKQGPVQTVSFTRPGHTRVTGATIKTMTAGGGWAEIKLISPVAQASNKAGYMLFCNRGVEGITATAAVQPTATSGSCATGPEIFTATGSITASKAEKVTYLWWQSDGQISAPATLTFTRPGTLAVQPLTITPPAGTDSGQVALAVTSPVNMASSSATYTVSCQAPSLELSAAVSPASQTLTSCTAVPAAFAFSGTITDSKAGTVSYHWQLPSGNGPTETLDFGQAGTQAVAAATYKPSSDSASGSGTIVVTSPGSTSSNTAAFTLKCAAQLSVDSAGAPTTATLGKAYSGTVTVTGGKSPYSWSATGLPTGLTIGSGTGAISGTPTATGTFKATVSVKDSSSPALTGTASITITVGSPLLITTSALPTATVGEKYSGTVTVTGGTGSYTVSATGLPPGLEVSATGVISGTPTQPGSFTVTVTATDSVSSVQPTTKSIPITVDPSTTPTPTPTTTLPGDSRCRWGAACRRLVPGRYRRPSRDRSRSEPGVARVGLAAGRRRCRS